MGLFFSVQEIGIRITPIGSFHKFSIFLVGIWFSLFFSKMSDILKLSVGYSNCKRFCKLYYYLCYKVFNKYSNYSLIYNYC